MQSLLGVGISTVVLIVLALIVIILALELWRVKKPASAVAMDVEKFNAAVDLRAKQMAADIRKEEPFFASFSNVITKVRSDAEAVLEKGEDWLMNTASQDAKIAAGQKMIDDANGEKQSKLQALNAHVAKLQAHAASLMPPAPQPPAAS